MDLSPIPFLFGSLCPLILFNFYFCSWLCNVLTLYQKTICYQTLDPDTNIIPSFIRQHQLMSISKMNCVPRTSTHRLDLNDTTSLVYRPCFFKDFGLASNICAYGLSPSHTSWKKEDHLTLSNANLSTRISNLFLAVSWLAFMTPAYCFKYVIK